MSDESNDLGFAETLEEVAHAYTHLGLDVFYADIRKYLAEEYTEDDEHTLPFKHLISLLEYLLQECRVIMRFQEILVYHEDQLKINYEKLCRYLSHLVMVVQAWPYDTYQQKLKNERHLEIVN